MSVVEDCRTKSIYNDCTGLKSIHQELPGKHNKNGTEYTIM